MLIVIASFKVVGNPSFCLATIRNYGLTLKHLELLETTFYVVYLPVISHCSDLSDDMPVNNSLLNPPSEEEKMRDLGSNGERIMRSYIRLRTRVAALRIRLPEEVEQSAKRAYREVENADLNDASAHYSRTNLGKLQQ